MISSIWKMDTLKKKKLIKNHYIRIRMDEIKQNKSIDH